MKTSSKVRSIALVILFAACEQTSDPFDNPLNGFLTSGTWKTASVSVTPGTINICERDNLFVFKNAGSLLIDQGALKCKTSDPSIFQTSWRANKDFTQITVDDWGWGTLPNVWNVTRLTSENLDFSIDFIINGIQTRVSYKLQKGDVPSVPLFASSVTSGAYSIQAKGDLRYIDINSSNNELRPTQNEQVWKILPATDGFFYIRPNGDISNVDYYVSQGKAGLWAAHGDANQQWKFVSRGDGYFTIENRVDARVMTSSASTSTVQLQNFSSQDAQLFRFYPKETDLYEGTGYSNVVQFGGGGFCTWSIQLRNVRLKFNISGSTVINATLTNESDEKTVIGGCGAVGVVQQSYNFLDGNIQGGSVTINFSPQNTNATKCNVRFSGTINPANGNEISGSLRWTRIDQGPPLNYQVTIPLIVVR